MCVRPTHERERKAYLIGGGIGNLAAAASLVRDGRVSGENIVILEAAATLGGALDAAGTAAKGYSMRGGRMLTTDNYECTWELFKTIPSLASPGKSVFQGTVEFNELHRSNAMARLVDRRRAKVPVRSMGFCSRDRMGLRVITLHNETDRPRRLTVTSAGRPVLFDAKQARTHPVFGSAAWMWRLGVEPYCVHIVVDNPEHVARGVKAMTVDGEAIATTRIVLKGRAPGTHEVHVRLGFREDESSHGVAVAPPEVHRLPGDTSCETKEVQS